MAQTKGMNKIEKAIAGVLVVLILVMVIAFDYAQVIGSFMFVKNFIMPENSNMVVTIIVALALISVVSFIINVVLAVVAQFVRKK